MFPKLLAREIRHSFGHTEVLRGVDFDLFPGEIHALVGERKSGKSTFARILSGDIRKQSGQIFIDGIEIPFLTPRTGLQQKIGIIYQNVNLLPTLTFMENVFLSRMPFFMPPWEKRKLREACLRLLDRFGLCVDIDRPLMLLPEADQQYIELFRLLMLEPEIVILDEISNRRTPAQMTKIVEILDHLKKEGRSIIYITTNVDEIFQLADRVTVIKDGLRKGTERVQDMDRLRLISMAYSFAMNLERDDRPRRGLRMNRLGEELIRSLPAGVALFNTSGKISVANSEVEELAASPGTNLRGLSLQELLSRIGIACADEIVEAFHDRRSATWEDVAYGQGKTLRLKMSALWNHEVHQGTILFMDDVTIDPKIKEYLSRADQVASIAELAAGVAHEINNPLGIIRNYLVLSKGVSDEEERIEGIERMEGELQRIVEIVQSLLSFSRVGLSNKRRVHLTALIDEVLVLLSHKLGEKEISIARRWPTEPIVVSVVENKIKQLFINLVVNACEAVLQHGKIIIEAERVSTGTEAEIRITDDGYGIAPEIRDKIFAPFFTTKMTKNNTGLGLSICQHIAELHGGVLLFNSVPGSTTFTLRLPLGSVLEESEAGAVRSEEAAPPGA